MYGRASCIRPLENDVSIWPNSLLTVYLTAYLCNRRSSGILCCPPLWESRSSLSLSCWMDYCLVKLFLTSIVPCCLNNRKSSGSACRVDLRLLPALSFFPAMCQPRKGHFLALMLMSLRLCPVGNCRRGNGDQRELHVGVLALDPLLVRS